ncbi:MAG: ATP-dependent DNA helicase RecG [Clostridia bacterium]|nr:ATP-dependent DNA helicase RecG [Clostridia bacterium]
MSDLLNQNITVLQGIGQKRAESFRTLGIYSVEDLLHFYPRAYEDRTTIKKIAEIKDGDTVCIRARAVTPLRENFVRKNMYVCSLKVSDGTGYLEIVWFNNHYIKNMLDFKKEYIFFGKASFSGRMQMHSPLFEESGKNAITGRIYPIYSLAAGITQKNIMSAVADAIKKFEIPEILPESIRKKYKLCTLSYAIRNIHFPKDNEALSIAKRRLAFDELFIFQTALRYLREDRTSSVSIPLKNTDCVKDFISSLPYPLTNAQDRVIKEICGDIKKTSPMSRLVQGDVGCGKTMIAAAAIFVCSQAGYTSAMMAPTEILAAQHYETLTELFKPFDIKVALITGSMTQKERKNVTEDIRAGKVQVIVGTHALISEKTELGNLALIVTDEQHRFGVAQRKSLEQKGKNPHVLIMTATPIPRTLAIILYGDLDISIIDELPPGRKPIDTFVLGEDMRARINAFLKKETDAGRQAYVVCPAVEPSEIEGIKDVMTHSTELKKLFDSGVEFLHGKMKPKEKDDIMRRFKDGEIKILVATSVIEVGVNVPNASVMVIENAARFGLSQLHQLRGRVGRGSDKAYCILFPGENVPVDTPRMAIMKNSSDGFKIAEEDLKLRGPGEFFGSRQHGLLTFKIANIYCDKQLLAQTSIAANEILANDRKLKSPENAAIHRQILKIFDTKVTFS